jgi:hypothetical protein
LNATDLLVAWLALHVAPGVAKERPNQVEGMVLDLVATCLHSQWHCQLEALLGWCGLAAQMLQKVPA